MVVLVLAIFTKRRRKIQSVVHERRENWNLNGITYLDACGCVPHTHGWSCPRFARCHETPVWTNAKESDLFPVVPTKISLAVKM